MDEYRYITRETATGADGNAERMDAPSDSPMAMKYRLRELEIEVQNARRRHYVADEELKRAEDAYRAASEHYVRALEATLGEHGLRASAPLTRGIDGDEVLDVDVRYFLKRMESWEEREKMTAERSLRALGVRAVGPLLRVMEKEAKRRDRWSIAAAGVSVFAIVLSMLGSALAPNRGTEPVYAFLLLVLIALIGTLRPTRMQKRAAQELSRFDDSRVIGPLVDGLALDDNYTRTVASAGLTRLLPRIRASDAGLLTREQLNRLYHTLDNPDSDLVVAILQGIEQIGDEEAAPHVEKLLERPAVSAKEKRLRAAAMECLPALRGRLGREEKGSLLLRAATSPASDQEDLLRPAESAAVNAEALLRPREVDAETG